MIIEEVREGSKLYLEALELRYELFFKQFDLPKSLTADNLELDSTHLVLTVDGQLLAYGRLSALDKETARISQLVVRQEHRRNGYASMMISELLKRAEQRETEQVVLNSQLLIIPLYRNLGFRAVGDTYTVELTGVEHQKMFFSFKN